jgi:hypothetical protein
MVAEDALTDDEIMNAVLIQIKKEEIVINNDKFVSI